MKNFFNSHKIAICVTALALSVGSVLCAYSVSNHQRSSKADNINNSYEKMLPAIENVSKQCALALANKTEPELKLEVKDTVPIYNVTNNIVGYSVSYYKDNTPYGYASFDFTTDELVTDFVIHKDTDSMYDVLSNSFAESNNKVEVEDCTNKLYSTTGIEYAVSATEGKKDKEIFYYNATTYDGDDFDAMLDYYENLYLDLYNNTEYTDNFYYHLTEEESQEDYIVQGNIADWFKKWLKKLFPSYFDGDDNFVEPTAYPNHSEVFKEVDKLVGEVSEPVMLPQYSREKSLTSQKTIMTTTNRYACGLVALTSICNQEDILLNGNIQDTFNKLWDLTGTQDNIYETGTFYGNYTVECSGTSIYQMAQGMKKYGKEIGADINTASKSTPSFTVFKNAVDNKLSSVLCYQIENEGGHGVSILGYAFGTVGKHTLDYLLAADGWYDDIPRYVLYNPALFQETTAITYKITKKAEPTVEPTIEPTVEPTSAPDVEPTATPSTAPSEVPTVDPTVAPSEKPAA